MTCEQVREWLGCCLDEEGAPQTRGAVEAHVAMCPNCAQELQSLRRVVAVMAQPDLPRVPSELWVAIEERLAKRETRRRMVFFTFRRLAAVAAILLIAIGIGLLGFPWGWDGARSAQAATVDFGVLLDGLKMGPDRAFAAFLAQYRPEAVSPAEAKAYAPNLTFELPDMLPGGFRRASTYKLHIGDKRGIAARYMRDGELLGFVFHPPILQMRFGERENRSCFIGKVQGQAVDVGAWTLSHLTDPTTCHCVLTRLDRASELPAIMSAIAPGYEAQSAPSHHHRP